jgi:acyl-CoA thioesterase
MADAIPPSALSLLTAPAMLSSINWTLELVTPLAEEERNDWFRFDSSLTAANDGYAWENTAIWSARGNLVALSRQCVAVFA